MEEHTKTEAPKKRSPRYTHTLSSSQISVIKYGIVEYLRIHKFCRAAVAILGMLLPIIWFAMYLGLIKFTIVPNASLFTAIIVVAPSLLWAAVVSGPEFELVLSTEDAAKERQLAEEKFEASKAPEDALNLDQAQLNEYYTINQNQARSSFRWAVICMFLGFGTIIGGVWYFYLGKTPDSYMASLSTAAGIVVQVVSGLFLYLHSRTQNQSLYFFQQLTRLQRISIAIRLMEAHKDSTQTEASRNLLIRELIMSAKIPDESDKAIPHFTGQSS